MTFPTELIVALPFLGVLSLVLGAKIFQRTPEFVLFLFIVGLVDVFAEYYLTKLALVKYYGPESFWPYVFGAVTMIFTGGTLLAGFGVLRRDRFSI
jgi:hypothetical protein